MPAPLSCEVLVHADIRTADGPAAYLGVADGMIVGLGAAPPCAAPRTVTLSGVVLPGFIDMHAHPAEGGRESMMLDLSGATTLEGLAEAVRSEAAAHPDAAWIEGAGWDAAVLDRLAPLHALDAVDRPVFLSSSDGHSAFVNTAAFHAAHLDPRRDPPGGHIDQIGRAHV